jgi:hypothetical protein
MVRAGTSSKQVFFILLLKLFAKIVHFTENFHEPIKHDVPLHVGVGSIHLIFLDSYNLDFGAFWGAQAA